MQRSIENILKIVKLASFLIWSVFWVPTWMMEMPILMTEQTVLYSLFGRWEELLYQESSSDHSPAALWGGLQKDHFLKNNNRWESEQIQLNMCLLINAEQCPSGRHADAMVQYLVSVPSPHDSSSALHPGHHRRLLAQLGRGSGSSSCLQERDLQSLSVQIGFSEQWISTVEMNCILICTRIMCNFLFWKRCPYFRRSQLIPKSWTATPYFSLLGWNSLHPSEL